MRITIDLPEDLLRRAKATAALRGLKLEILIATILDKGLNEEALEDEQKGRGRPLHVFTPATGEVICSKSNAEIFEELNREDDEPKGPFS